MIRFSVIFFLAALVVAGNNLNAEPYYNVVDSIQASVENPTGFIAPGDSVQINVRVTNPVGSGLVLEGISGSSHLARPYPIQGTITWIGSDSGLYTIPELCTGNLPCAVEGEFPVAEGESVLLAYRSINVPESVVSGTALGFNSISLNLETGQEDIDVYSSNNVVYLVSEGGNGDPSAFDDYVIDQPPLVFPQVQTHFDFPPAVTAGTHFNLRTTLTNVGTEPLSGFISMERVQIPSPYRVDGSFQVQRCSIDCDLVSRHMLNPGESVLKDLGNYYYVDDLLQDSELLIENISFTVTDTAGRRFSIVPQGLPLTVTVTGPENGPVENPADDLPAREPLLQQDFVTSGDGLLIHDPNTGFDWIRLDASRGIPPQVLSELLEEMPELAGFRLARSSEVHELALDYLHGRGVPAFEFQLLDGNNEINAALYDFIELIGVTYQTWIGTSRTTRGVVADKQGLGAYPEPYLTSVSIRSDDPAGWGVTSPRGVQRVRYLANPFSQPAGYWLVRTHTPPSAFIPAGARYRNDELVIPALKVGADRLAVTMNFRNLVGGLLQVTGVEGLTDAYAAIDGELNLETGELVIPRLALEAARNHYLDLRLVLRYLRDSDPPTFQLWSAESVTEP